MKLVGIEFYGFKSFADSADIKFHDGITAIVGPNGCGKSNVADGLRWVLGEQRPTAIRGSRMEEAIFQGTEKRKPIQRAEVTLKLSNEDHLLPVPYSEVEINRTVHTGGEGEYRLNGSLCRLRDIQDLCRDTGLGTNAYAIIENRMVDAILSDKAEERRAMFEEAAGIGRYKERRRVAARRLDEADGDLARVDDLISEVQTKVRSLARQRGRARRYLEFRERKLALELALADAEIARLQRREREIETELASLAESKVHDAAQLRAGEAEHEGLKARLNDLERERADGARKLMAVRDRLSERERERLLAEERGRHLRERLDQVEREREELFQRETELQSEVESLGEIASKRSAALQELRDELQRREVVLAEIAERRQAMEAAEAAAESERQSYREERARLQARGEAGRAEAAELERRLAEARDRLEEAAARSREIESEEARAREAAERAQAGLQSLSSELRVARERLAALQSRHEEVRARSVALNERLRATVERIEAVEPLASGEDGLNPAVRAALERARELGIRGVLGRSIEVPAEHADGVEAYLGAYMEGLLVDDSAAVARLRRWFLEDYRGPGGLVVLPLNRPNARDDLVPLPDGIRVRGAGARWARRLLRGVRLQAGGAGVRDAGGAWIGERQSRDDLGVHRFGRPYAGAGLLARRAELERLIGLRDAIEAESRDLRERVEQSSAQEAEQETRVDELQARRRAAEEDAGGAAARAEGAEQRATAAKEQLVALRESVARLEEERASALRRAESAERALSDLRPVEDTAAPDPEELARVRAAWEEAREQLTEIQLEEARAAAATDRAERELRGQERQAEATRDRLERLAEEASELEKGRARAEEEAEAAAAELQELFEEREGREREVRELEERAEEMRARASEIEGLLRRVQQEERDHAERRHELQLERTQLAADLKRTRERLEDEWGRPFDELAQEVEPAVGDSVALREELTEVAERLGRIGLVNMLAEQEYQEEQERLEFLEGQRADLVGARDDLRRTIREINETASKALLETLEQVRANFERTFSTLFEGGECDVWLEDPNDPLDSPIEISASPGGKRTQRIHLLSGGERALTALSLLFAIYLVKPSPFCVLDEVDAPLDETNIRRFVAMLEEFKSGVQFIVITHNPVTIEAADWIFGVTMEEPGVSKIVGVELSEYARGAVA